MLRLSRKSSLQVSFDNALIQTQTFYIYENKHCIAITLDSLQ